jgi:hypothetical protein
MLGHPKFSSIADARASTAVSANTPNSSGVNPATLTHTQRPGVEHAGYTPGDGLACRPDDAKFTRSGVPMGGHGSVPSLVSRSTNKGEIRMRKILRVGLLVASLSGLVATLAPTPAEATTAGGIAFRGVAIVEHGIADPLINNSQPGPPFHLSTSKAAPFIHNSAVISNFQTTTCVGAVASNKSAPPPGKVTAGQCTITPKTPGATGTVHGYCGLSDGTVRVFVNAGGFSYSVNVSFVVIHTKLVISGHWHKHGTTHSGPLVGTAQVAPDFLNLAGTGIPSSCLNKARKAFIVTGAAVFGGGSGTSTSHLSLPRVSSPASASVSFGF